MRYSRAKTTSCLTPRRAHGSKGGNPQKCRYSRAKTAAKLRTMTRARVHCSRGGAALPDLLGRAEGTLSPPLQPRVLR